MSIDADLQDDIDAMDGMWQKYLAGADIVCGVRSDRSSDTFLKRTTAQGYYRLMAALGSDLIYNHADYRLMSRAVKAQQQPLAAPVLRRVKTLSVTADHLIGCAVYVVVRYLLCSVRKPDCDGVFKAAVKILGEKPAVIKRNIHH